MRAGPVVPRSGCCSQSNVLFALSQISRTRFAGRLREASRTANPLCLHVAPRNTIYCSSPLILRASPLSSKSLGRPSVLLLTFFMSQLWHSFELAQLCSVWIAFVSIGSHKREEDASCLGCGLLWPVSSNEVYLANGSRLHPPVLVWCEPGSAMSMSSWTRSHFRGLTPSQNPS